MTMNLPFFMASLLWLSIDIMSPVAAGSPVIVDIVGQGRVRGIKENTTGPVDSCMYSFYGIPYGRDTSGTRRFKPTSSPDPWTGTRDCAQPNLERICPQIDAQRNFFGQEDCLDLSVYTPSVQGDSSALYPVLVYFHRGLFVENNNYMYRGDNLLNSNEIVLVVPNYRLGFLGFLCLHQEDAPCNAGLYDQLLALQWVRDHIQQFGGDPNRVTIAGSGAGSTSVHLLMLYQDTNKRYFDQVIGAGSTSFGIASVDESPVVSAKAFGASQGCNTVDMEAFIDCMVAMPAENLTKYLYRLENYTGAFPAVQKVGSNRILSEHPRAILPKNPPSFAVVPTLLGTNKHEGSFFTGFLYYVANIESDPTWWSTGCIPFLADGARDIPGLTADAILDKFFGGEYAADFSEGIGSLIDACSAIFYNIGVDEIASGIQAVGGDVFVYSFEYKGSLTTFTQFGPIPIPSGVSHGDDVLYIFSDPASLTPEDKAVRDNLIRLWINFIKTGNPGENTPVYTATNRRYLEITESFAIKDDYRDTFVPCKGVSGDENNCVYTS